jgi:transposase-like protein
MDKTADVKCPNCKSNNCEVISQSGLSLGCKCNECKREFIVLDTDGVPTLTDK